MIKRINEQMMEQTDKATTRKISMAWFIVSYTALFLAGLALTLMTRKDTQ